MSNQPATAQWMENCCVTAASEMAVDFGALTLAYQTTVRQGNGRPGNGVYDHNLHHIPPNSFATNPNA